MKFTAEALLQLANREQPPVENEYATRWTMVKVDGSNDKCKLIRNVLSTVLYRGQNHHFDPCWPSMCRGFQRHASRVMGLNPIDQARLLKCLSLNRWFADELAKHPMIKWAKSEGIFIDEISLAQHYGVPTAYIDVSESLQIATFFATCRFVQRTATWEPMTEGEGVMYSLQFNAIDERISPICYQPFPRPLQQWAWTVELRLGENFLQVPKLQGFRFEHDAKVGEEMLKRFDGGAKLLPPDPTARLAAAICSAPEVPTIYIEEVESWLASDPNGLRAQDAKYIRKIMQDELKITLTNSSAVYYTQHELNIAENEWRKSDRKFPAASFRVTLPSSNDEREV